MATNTFTSLPPLTIDSLKQSMELLKSLTLAPLPSHIVAHPSAGFFKGVDPAVAPDRTAIGCLGSLGGIKVITSPLMTMIKQARFPRSKKQRIRRKWAKKYTQTVPSDKVLVFSQEAMRCAMDRTMRKSWGL